MGLLQGGNPAVDDRTARLKDRLVRTRDSFQEHILCLDTAVPARWSTEARIRSCTSSSMTFAVAPGSGWSTSSALVRPLAEAPLDTAAVVVAAAGRATPLSAMTDGHRARSLAETVSAVAARRGSSAQS